MSDRPDPEPVPADPPYPETGDIPGGSPPRQTPDGEPEPAHPPGSPSQTPAERAYHAGQGPIPPEIDRHSPVQRWVDEHLPPKEQSELEQQQIEQGEQLRRHRMELYQAQGRDPLQETTQGHVAPEPEGARDHEPGEFEQPPRWDPPWTVQDPRPR